MSNKSLLTEFKWQLKKQAYQLGTPSPNIPIGDVSGGEPAGSYREAMSAAAQHRADMNRELNRYIQDYGAGGQYAHHITQDEYSRGVQERQFALRNASRAVPLAATDLGRAQAAQQGLRPGFLSRIFRGIGSGIRNLLPATPRIGRVV
jgi:uncharacterized protein YukE